MSGEWHDVKLGEVLAQVKRPVVTAEQSRIAFAGVRWYAGGVYRRDETDAADVKTRVLNRL
jgi:type I restriction enzyme S subunit